MSKTLAIFLTFFVLTLIPVPSAAACDNKPIPYFVESFTFTAAQLPDGILVAGAIDDTRGFISWGILDFSNQTGAGARLVGAQHAESLAAALASGPEAFEQAVQAISGQSLDIPPGGSGLSIDNFHSVVPDFRSGNQAGFTRRPDIPIPDSQEVGFILISGGQIYPFSVTLAYQLNPDFREQLCPMDAEEAVPAPETVSVDEGEPQKICLAAAGAALFLLIPFCLFKVRKRITGGAKPRL